MSTFASLPDTREIALTKGYVAIVDADQFEALSAWRWRAHVGRYGHVYAVRNNGKIAMHRVIASAGRGQMVDHVNGDTLDNRGANIRLCSAYENSCNAKPFGEVPFKGVSLDHTVKSVKYRVAIQAHGVRIPLGRFDTAEAAARAYDAAALLHHGSFAKLNFPEVS